VQTRTKVAQFLAKKVVVMKKRLVELLFEAHRRNDMADSREKAKPLGHRWLGLGTAAAYRPALETGLMVFCDGMAPLPRCMGWLTLTPAGIAAMQEMEEDFAQALAVLKKDRGYASSYASMYQVAGGFAG